MYFPAGKFFSPSVKSNGMLTLMTLNDWALADMTTENVAMKLSTVNTLSICFFIESPFIFSFSKIVISHPYCFPKNIIPGACFKVGVGIKWLRNRSSSCKSQQGKAETDRQGRTTPPVFSNPPCHAG